MTLVPSSALLTVYCASFVCICISLNTRFDVLLTNLMFSPFEFPPRLKMKQLFEKPCHVVFKSPAVISHQAEPQIPNVKAEPLWDGQTKPARLNETQSLLEQYSVIYIYIIYMYWVNSIHNRFPYNSLVCPPNPGPHSRETFVTPAVQKGIYGMGIGVPLFMHCGHVSPWTGTHHRK